MTRFRTKILPRNAVDAIAVLFLVAAAVGHLFYDLFVLLPYLEIGASVVFHLAFLLYLSVNVLGNLWNLVTTDTSVMCAKGTDKIKVGWHYCSVCESTIPPRAFHCEICNVCILRRDHHCIFTAACVGFFNHRYYLGLIAHLWVGAVYSILLTLASGYLWQLVGGINLGNFFCLMCPVVSTVYFFSGAISMSVFAAVLFFDVCFYGLFFLTILLLHQSTLMVSGQTTYEKGNDIYTYQLRTKEANIVSVLGHRPLATMLWFNSKSLVPGDGVKFEQRKATNKC